MLQSTLKTIIVHFFGVLGTTGRMTSPCPHSSMPRPNERHCGEEPTLPPSSTTAQPLAAEILGLTGRITARAPGTLINALKTAEREFSNQ